LLAFYQKTFLNAAGRQSLANINDDFPNYSFQQLSLIRKPYRLSFLFFYNIVWRLRKHEDLFQGSQKNESPGKKILVLITG